MSALLRIPEDSNCWRKSSGTSSGSSANALGLIVSLSLSSFLLFVTSVLLSCCLDVVTVAGALVLDGTNGNSF